MTQELEDIFDGSALPDTSGNCQLTRIYNFVKISLLATHQDLRAQLTLFAKFLLFLRSQTQSQQPAILPDQLQKFEKIIIRGLPLSTGQPFTTAIGLKA